MSDNFIPELEVEHISCTVENIVDSKWLFNNIPWMNHSNKTAHLTLDKTSTVFYYNDGVKSITFNEMGVSAFHGFAGNSYAFSFLLDGEEVYLYSQEPKHIGLAEDEVIQKAWDATMYKLRRNAIARNKILNQLKKIDDKM